MRRPRPQARTTAADVAEWFDGAQRGEPESVDGLLRAVFPTAQRFAASSCDSPADAEDAAQEALTALVRRVGALRAAEAVTSWLFVTIRNACLPRRSAVRLVPVDIVPERAVTDPAGAVVDRVVAAEALAGLSPTHREIVVLVDLLGLPVDRAAEHLGIGVRAAKSRLHRGRRALALALAPGFETRAS